MTTAEIINRLFECYPWAKLEVAEIKYIEVSIGFRDYQIECGFNRGLSVVNLAHDGHPEPDQRHAIHLRDVLLGKKRNEAGELV